MITAICVESTFIAKLSNQLFVTNISTQFISECLAGHLKFSEQTHYSKGLQYVWFAKRINSSLILTESGELAFHFI